MKKYLLIILITVPMISLIFPKNISPVISIRYDNLDAGVKVSDAIGLKMDLGGNKFSGFDTDGVDYRIYVGWEYGKIGFGHDGADTQYTVGATYGVLDNIDMDLDYVLGSTENIRLALNIHF